MNTVYNRFLHRRYTNAADLASATIRCLLLRNTGPYVANPDHDFVADLFSNSAVEITAAGYARQTITGLTITLDDANDRSVMDFNDVDFGSLPSGQTVSGVVFYEYIVNDASSPLINFIDGKIKVSAAAPLAAASLSGTITGATQANPVVITSAGHSLQNGQQVYITGVAGMTEINNQLYTVGGVTSTTFQLTGINGTAFTAYTSGGTWNQVQTLYVDKLTEPINSGTSVTIGTATGVVRANAVKNDRLLKISAVSGAIAAGDFGEVQSGITLPAALGSGNFVVRINASGFLAFVPRV